MQNVSYSHMIMIDTGSIWNTDEVRIRINNLNLTLKNHMFGWNNTSTFLTSRLVYSTKKTS